MSGRSGYVNRGHLYEPNAEKGKIIIMVKTNRLRAFAQKKIFVLLVLLIVVAVFYQITTKGDFLTWFNIKNILSSMVVTTYLTCGAVFLMISGHIDLSTAQVATISGIMFAKLMSGGVPFVPALLITILIGAIVGTLNAVLINEVGFQAFIATMAVSYVVQGSMLMLSNGSAIQVTNRVAVWIGTYKIAGEIPVNIVFTLVIFTIYGVVLARTRFGKSIYLIGGNPTAARLAGLKPKMIWYILFINNAMLGAVGGALQAMRLKAGTVTGIANGQFAGMTGAILGGVSFGGGAGGMGGAFAGLVLLNGFNTGLMNLGVTPYFTTVASGALLLIALTFDWFNAKRISGAKNV
jgi:ribose/xylose/arabinose/galactoside ABC-type transport system permease subunit